LTHDLQDFPGIWFPVYLILLWLVGTTSLGWLSGWYRLMQSYPDRVEPTLLKLTQLSGTLGRVSMGGILNISVCPSGLRFGMMRIFGPFCREFFVPWDQIQIVRKEEFFYRMAVISFGRPVLSKLKLSANLADRLALAANGEWPEPGPFKPEPINMALSRVGKQWLVSTAFVSTFFFVGSRVLPHRGEGIPIVVAILFPASVFGLGALFRCFQIWRKGKSRV